jgi:glutamine synthetase
MDGKEILKQLVDKEIKVVRLWFCDILGQLKGFNVSVSQLESTMEEGIWFDGSSVEGFVRIEESDLLALPDFETFRIIPFEMGGARTAFMICDVFNSDGTPFESDPRFVLRKTMKRAKDMGLDFNVGLEVEYFYFPDERTPCPLDQGGYFDVLPLDESASCRKRTFLALQKLGIEVETSHHEVSTSQHEIDLRYGDALKMADNLMVTRVIIKDIARIAGLYATFMPKPVFGINGSGMHCHQSLFRDGENAFYDASDEYNLSDMAKRYIAGLLRHSKEFTSVTNQWVNSYKRLVVGYEAPAYISWGRKNRSALVRVPGARPDRPKSTRAEYRAPDPACNPYLAFSVMLAAGMKGMEEKYELAAPVEEDIYTMPEETKAKYGIDALPDSLYSAIIATEGSDLVRETFGEGLFDKYVKNKKAEWEAYRTRVTDYEIETYMPKL